MANNTLLASDNFVSGSLAAGWSANTGAVLGAVVNAPPNVVQPTALSASCGQIWTGLTWPNDHISEITVNAFTNEGSTLMRMLVRWQTGANSGYYCQIANSAITLIRNDAGAGTTLASGATTLAASDILTLSAIGSCISVYKNGARILYFYDTTYTGGSPGFFQFSSTNVTHTRVGAWRGYSAVQQDGVWQKQGAVIPANSADLPSGCANPSNIILGPAKLLSGTVMKMWFTSWSANAIGYAESATNDGINWTRHNGAVLSGVIDPSVIQNGSTLYLYALSNTGGTGHGPVNVYTSPTSDGINWTLAASNIAGATQFFFQPFAIIAGTWYALASQTLWTSSDGLAWSSQGNVYPGNPGGAMSGGIVAANGTYYSYNQYFNPGATGAGEGTETNRLKCLNPGTFTSWAVDAHSMHITGMHEGVNTFNGQCVPGPLIQVGNQTYSYFTQCPGDITTPSIYQICLSIAPTSLANLVSFPEDAAQQVATDPFTGGAGSLGANWTDGTAALKVIAGPFVTATATNTACWDIRVGTYGNSQYCEVTIHSMTNSGLLAPFVRNPGGGNAFTWYEALITGNTGSTATVQIRSRNAGAAANIGPSLTINLAANDKIRVQVYNGSDGFPVITVFQNNFSVLQVQDYANLIPSGGNPGFYIDAIAATTDVQVASWSGGNAAVIPSYPVASSIQVGAFLVGP